MPDNNFMQIISSPKMNAPNKHINAIGLILKSGEGLINNNPPKREINAADHLKKPTFSFNKNTARAIANTGFKKLIAVSSLTGI